MIRRGGVTDIAWVFARLEIKASYLINTLPRCNYGSGISQLSVLASPNFGSVAYGAFELYVLQFGRCYFF